MTSKSRLIDLADDYPVIILYTAIWALRFVLNNPQSSLLARDADDFLKFVGEHLMWPTTSLEILLDKTSLDEDAKDEIRELGFQKAWLQFRDDYTNPHEDAILKAFRRLARNENTLIKRIIKTSLIQLEKKLVLAKNPMMKNTLMLQEMLGLSDVDSAILNYSGQMMQSQHARALARLIPTRSFDDAVQTIATILLTDTHEVATSLKSSGLLLEYGLIEVRRDPRDLEDVLSVPANVQPCLGEKHDHLDQMMLHFISPAKVPTLTIDDYPHLDADRLSLNRFLKGSRDLHANRVNIMFYGEPGTGKTEFAKVLACEAGFKLYEVASSHNDGAPLTRAERLAFLRISLRFLADDKNALLLFDEIEDVFPKADDSFKVYNRNTAAYYGKAWMNHTLENNPIPVIWVSNAIDQIDPAFLRRFSYHLEFRKPPLKVRHRIAEKYLKSTAVSRDFIQQVAQKSALTPALIESAARVVSLSKVDDSNEAEHLVSRIIQQSQSAMGLNGNSDLRVSPTGYRLDYLNVDSRHSIEQIAESLKRNPSATMCFYGLPGTGKTALAEHLAGEQPSAACQARIGHPQQMAGGIRKKHCQHVSRGRVRRCHPVSR